MRRARRRVLVCSILSLALGPGAGCKATGKDAAAADACSLGSLSPSPLRRLTTAQYFNSLHDLFPSESGTPLAILPERENYAKLSLDTAWLPVEQEVGGYAGIASAQVVSPLLVERYGENALRIAAEVGDRRDDFVGCDVEADPDGCGKAYVTDLARRAWRRPLSSDEKTNLSADYEQDLARDGPVVALQLGIQTILQSPHFLYLPELAESEAPSSDGHEDCSVVPLGSHEMAARLSYFLWNTTPDAWLSGVADDGELVSRESIETIAREMMDDPRYLDGALAFHDEWLRMGRVQGYSREVMGAPVFDPGLHLPLLREQMRRFVGPISTEPDRGFSELLTSTRFPMHGGLTDLYGVQVDGLEPVPPGQAPNEVWIEAEVPADERAGVLTMAGFLSAHASFDRASPVRRGVFVLDRLMCAKPPPPPPGVDTSIDDEPTMGEPQPRTNRARFAEHTTNDACRGCHEAIDPVGFAFEHYNATGSHWALEAWTEAGPDMVEWLDVDASGRLAGSLVPDELQGLEFEDAVALLQALADSEAVHQCYARHRYEYALGRGIDLGSGDTPSADDILLGDISADFYGDEGALDALVLGIVTSDAFMNRVEGPR